MKALIMGGGMSGLATAINLLDQGFAVELIEADEMFGGRASSWTDEDGDMIDNALHVFFPYYVNLVNFFKKVGVADKIMWKRPEYYYAQDNGEMAVLRFPNLPAPFHAAAALMGMMKSYKGTPPWKMLFTALAIGNMVTKTDAEIDELDNISWGQWVMRRGPIGAFDCYDTGIRGLTFTYPWAVSAKVFANWARKISASTEDATIGFANGGLGEIWVDNCLAYIKKKGGTYKLNQKVTAINVEDGQVKSVTVNGTEERTADIYVSAISPYALRGVLPKEAFFKDYFKDLTYFQLAPSLSIQIWFDKKLTDVDVTFFTDNSIFNTYADLSNVLPHIFKGGSMFEMVISPATAVNYWPDEVIFDEVIKDIKRVFPSARDAAVKKWKVVRVRQGVYSPVQGMEKHRPFQRSPYGNFYLTGDYTKTPVSSGGMEAAIWTANKCTELIAEDKLGKKLDLNIKFNPNKGFSPFMRPLKQIFTYGMALFLAAKGFKVLRSFR